MGNTMRRFVVVLTIALVSLLAFSPITFAQTDDLGTVGPAVNIRSGPATAYGIIRTVPSGTEFTVLGQDVTGSWLAIRLADGAEGWIARFLTDVTATLPIVATPPLEQPPLAPPPAVPGDVGSVQAAANVNIRTGPATAYGIIRTVPAGTQFTILGQDVTGSWLSIRMADGTEGWVARFLTNVTATLPVVATPPLEQPPLAPPPAVPGDPGAVQGATNVNIRTGPATSYAVIRTVPAGTQFAILGQDVTGGWLAIRLADGAEGWIARFLTDVTAIVPTVGAPPLQQPPLAPPPAVPEAEAGIAALPGQSDSLVDPPVNEALGANWRILPEGSAHWYAFQHSGNGEVVQIWMDAEPNEGAGFFIFDEGQAQAVMSGTNPEEASEIGAGTSNDDEPGDLFWRGEFEEAGTFYVLVHHGGQGTVSYSIYGSGPGFSR